MHGSAAQGQKEWLCCYPILDRSRGALTISCILVSLHLMFGVEPVDMLSVSYLTCMLIFSFSNFFVAALSFPGMSHIEGEELNSCTEPPKPHSVEYVASRAMDPTGALVLNGRLASRVLTEL